MMQSNKGSSTKGPLVIMVNQGKCMHIMTQSEYIWFFSLCSHTMNQKSRLFMMKPWIILIIHEPNQACKLSTWATASRTMDNLDHSWVTLKGTRHANYQAWATSSRTMDNLDHLWATLERTRHEINQLSHTTQKPWIILIIHEPLADQPWEPHQMDAWIWCRSMLLWTILMKYRSHVNNTRH